VDAVLDLDERVDDDLVDDAAARQALLEVHQPFLRRSSRRPRASGAVPA
jgi:hypothetical protein